MNLPVINQAIEMVIRGKHYAVTCLDVFDGGYGYYFDALFPKPLRVKFVEGEPCGIPGYGGPGGAEFASHPKHEGRTIRFLISKWI